MVIKIINKIDIQIGVGCNKKCEWCPPYFNNKINFSDVNFNLINKIISIIQNYKFLFNETLKISFSRYNEPLLFKKHLSSLIYKFKNNINNKKIIFSINTNGELLDKNDNFLFEYFNIITINDYMNNKILSLNNISKKFIKKEIKNINFDDKNNEIYFRYFNSNITYSYKKQDLSYMRNRGGIIKDKKFLRDIIPENKKKCDVLGNILCIDYNGDVFPCCETSSMNKEHSCMKVGNIFNDNFQEIYDNLIKFDISIHKNICNDCGSSFEMVK